MTGVDDDDAAPSQLMMTQSIQLLLITHSVATVSLFSALKNFIMRFPFARFKDQKVQGNVENTNKVGHRLTTNCHKKSTQPSLKLFSRLSLNQSVVAHCSTSSCCFHVTTVAATYFVVTILTTISRHLVTVRCPTAISIRIGRVLYYLITMDDS